MSAAIIATAFVYALPEEPDAIAQRRVYAPPKDYIPGGSGCHPAKLRALPADGSEGERDRCAAAAEEHRRANNELNQAIRAADIADRELVLHAKDARGGFLQTMATVAAFVAAAWAAGVAWRAMVWARAAAKDTKRSADAAHDQLEAVKTAERAYIATSLDLYVTTTGGLRMYVGNTGRTFCNIHSVYFVVRTRLPSGPHLRGIRLARIECDRDVAANTQEQLPDIPAPIPASAKHVLGYVRYRDVYRAWHRTYFRYDLNPSGAWSTAGGQKWNRTDSEQPPDHLGSPLPVT